MLDQCQRVANNLNDELLPSMSDAMVAVGERLSARVIAALLRQNDIRGVTVDGTELIVTDDVHGNANPLLQRTAQRVQDLLLPMLDREIVPVVTGYIGATETGETTTLGRGGTDFTASVLSALLGAEALWIWSDVDGLMSADPREISSARVIPRLDYNEAAELAYFGAKILHAKMIAPLAKTRDSFAHQEYLPSPEGWYGNFWGSCSGTARNQSRYFHPRLGFDEAHKRFDGGHHAAGGQYALQDPGHANRSDDRLAIL